MNTPSDPHKKHQILREKIIGLGEHSIQKSYYPQLQQQVKVLEEHKQRLEQQSQALSQMVEELQAARKSWQEIFQAIGHPTLILDTDYHILAANRAAVTVTGISEHELKNRTCSDVFGVACKGPQQCPMSRMLTSPQAETIEMEIEAFNRVFLCSCTPVFDEQGELQQIIHISTDITGRKRAEQEIRTLNAELEMRVQQRTAELEAVNQELKEFAYIVSHDLKAPLHGINHVVHWLVEDYGNVIDEKGQELMDVLISRVKKMDSLIDGVLHYSRVSRIEEKYETIDLNDLLYDVLDLLNPPEHVQITIEPHFPAIVAEPTRVFQIFQNLFSNAIKFLDKPQGEIRVEYQDKSTHWMFSVTDNGPGIEQRHQERIFQIFQTVHPHDEVESTGIGLALVKKIVELYGGKIWVESTPGEGSTFWFTLPKKQGTV